ncbi:MAG: hypothetical protein H6832_00075 [Planctomycetes bacterium]|nr:hypothetical protein [Planctomycetota bacterium]MCB9916778.1 hypothetical protein [Planctomycetota bacterium]
MQSALPSTKSPTASALVASIFEEIDAIGPRLANSIPGFSSLWLVGTAANGDFELAETGSAWVCSSELSFVLVSDTAIAAPTLRCLQAGIGIRLGGLRVRLNHYKTPWLAQQATKRRSGFELVLSRKLIAGDPAPVEALDFSFVSKPCQLAVENLCVDTLELLLRAHPDAPMLERGSANTDFSDLVLRGSLTEIARNSGDAILLAGGTFATERVARSNELARIHGDGNSLIARIHAWAFGAQPLLDMPPCSPTEVWNELRRETLRSLKTAVETRLERQLDRDTALLRHVRNCRRSTWSRVKRFVHGKRRAGGREYTQLLLLLTLLADDQHPEHRELLRAGNHLLSLVGGPILANPEWRNLRREALLVEPWQHLLAGPLLLESKA